MLCQNDGSQPNDMDRSEEVRENKDDIGMGASYLVHFLLP